MSERHPKPTLLKQLIDVVRTATENRNNCEEKGKKMKFWLLRPKGFDNNYTDSSSCWGCVVRAPDRETALALAATSELRLSGDFPDGWDVTEIPAEGPPAVIMFDY